MGPATEVWSGADDVPCRHFRSASLLSRLPVCAQLVTSVRQWAPDIAYFRFGAWFPPLRHLLKTIPTVVELNTDDVREFRATLPWLMFQYHRLTRNRLLNSARAFVSVTREIADRFADFDKPTAVISNGIDLADYRPAPPPTASRPRLLFLGDALCPWNGVDRIVAIASKLTDCDFDIVGYERQEMAGSLPDNVRVHGHLPRQRYEGLVQGADAAFGTMALDRKEMLEACPLKVREYLAFGVPTIIGYRDTDFAEGAPFLLHVNAAEDDVDSYLPRIRSFLQRIDRTAIRHLDISQKESARLQFFADVLSQ
jgi:glycosyltransferase involved in cell wall biosynthesis